MAFRQDVDAAISRASSPDAVSPVLIRAATALESVLKQGEQVLECAERSSEGQFLTVFVTNLRVLCELLPTSSPGEPAPSTNSPGVAQFEAFSFDQLSNIRTEEAGSDEIGTGGAILIMECYTVWSARGGFGPLGAERLKFAAQWALQEGRETRTTFNRNASPAQLFEQWRVNRDMNLSLENSGEHNSEKWWL